MAFWKKSEDPWDRKPGRDWLNKDQPKEPKENPIDSLKQWNEDRKTAAKEKEEAKRLPPEPCPWCGKDMEQGYLFASHGAYWYSGIPAAKALRKAVWLGSNLTDSLQVCDEGDFLTAYYKTTWFCRECKKMVFDMTKPEKAESEGTSAEALDTPEEE